MQVAPTVGYIYKQSKQRHLDAKITTNGTGDLTIDTNGGTNSGSIVIADGANGAISIDPNGTGNLTLGSDDNTTTALTGNAVNVAAKGVLALTTSSGNNNITL